MKLFSHLKIKIINHPFGTGYLVLDNFVKDGTEPTVWHYSSSQVHLNQIYLYALETSPPSLIRDFDNKFNFTC